MPTFDAGSISGEMRLGTGGWEGAVRKVIADSQNLIRRMTGIGASTRPAEVGIRNVAASASSAATALASLGATATIGMLAKSFITAASTAENYRVRLTALLGSQAEGNRLFAEMSAYAATSTASYEAIMGAATNLSGILKGGVDQIKTWIPIIDDLAAASGLSVTEATSQVQRMLSAGAGAADQFRDRGVLAMLGFTAGVTYSAKESAAKVMAAWEGTDSKFRGLAAKLADTWTGQVGMMVDKWFIFRNKTMDAGIFDGVKNALKSLNAVLDSGMVALDGWLATYKDVVTRVVLGAAAFTAAGVALGSVAMAATALKGILAVTGGVIGLTAAQAGILGVALAGAAVLAATHWDQTRIGLSAFAGAVATTAESVASFFARMTRASSDALGWLQIKWNELAATGLSAMGKIATGAQASALLFKNAWLEAVKTFLWLDEKIVAGISFLPGFGSAKADAAELRREIGEIDKEISANQANRSNLWGSVTPGIQKALDELKGQKAALQDLMKNPTAPESYLDSLAGTANSAADFWAKETSAATMAAAQNAAAGHSITDTMKKITAEAKKATDALFGIGDGAATGAGKAAGKTASGIDEIKTHVDALVDSAKFAQEMLDNILESSDMSGLDKLEPVARLVQRANPAQEMVGWAQQIADYQVALGALPAETVNAISLDLWGQMGDAIERQGTGKVRELIGQIAAIEPGMAKAVEVDIAAQGLDQLSSKWSQLGSTLADIGPRFDAASKAANVASAIMASSADFVSGKLKTTGDKISAVGSLFANMGAASGNPAVQALGAIIGVIGAVVVAYEFMTAAATEAAITATIAWLAILGPIQLVVIAITAAAAAFAIFGGKAKEEVTAVDKVFEQIGKSVNGWVDQFTDAIVEFVKTGKASFKDFAESVMEDMLKIVLKYAIIQPILTGLGVPSSVFNAKGNAFEGGNILPFAKGAAFAMPDMPKPYVPVANILPFASGGAFAAGTVVNKATAFNMGVMGEAGPEAIMPLKRTADGSLGVRAIGGSAGVGAMSIPQIIINDYSTRVVQPEYDVKPEMGPDGIKAIKIAMRDAVSENFAMGAHDRDMASNFGVKRRAR